MKKLMVMGLVLAAGLANADISILWTNSGVVLDDTSGTEAPVADGSLVQLIWSLDYSSLATTEYGSDLLNENEYLLDSTITTASLGHWSSSVNTTYADADVGGNDITSGYLFTRVFADETPTVGSYYAQGLIDDPTLITYDAMSAGTTYSDSVFSDATYVDTQAIPEPATVLIFAPGIAGLLAYRRRKTRLAGQLRDLFEHRQDSSLEASKAVEGAERDAADYVTRISDFFLKRQGKKFDPLGDLLMAIDSRGSK